MLSALKGLLKDVKRIYSIEDQIITISSKLWDIHAHQINDMKNPKVTTGKLLSNLNNAKKEIDSLHEVEFQIFSQWGDDGIIQYLIHHLHIPNKTFIEFGVENYIESNTRFLLINNNWTGLVLDGDPDNVRYIENDTLSGYFDLYSRAVFITKENINTLLKDSGFDKELGILSVDIDGNDYWIWKAVDEFKPIIVISEYNSLFGYDNPWTLPYKADFVRPGTDNPLRVFYGSSLLSLCDLAEEKGYYFVGCNSNGNNAYFIRKDKIGQFKPLSAKEGFVKCKFREVLLPTGRLAGENRDKAIKGQQVYNTRTNTLEIIS